MICNEAEPVLRIRGGGTGNSQIIRIDVGPTTKAGGCGGTLPYRNNRPEQSNARCRESYRLQSRRTIQTRCVNHQIAWEKRIVVCLVDVVHGSAAIPVSTV